MGKDVWLWGWGNDGGEEGVGKGAGERLYQSFEQNRYRYIQFGYRYASYATKSAKIVGNPHFQGGIPIK